MVTTKNIRPALRKGLAILFASELLINELSVPLVFAQEASVSATPVSQEAPASTPTSTPVQEPSPTPTPLAPSTPTPTATPVATPALSGDASTPSAILQTPIPTMGIEEPSVEPSLAPAPVTQQSAALRLPIKIKELTHRDFQANEKLQIVVENATDEDVSVSVKAENGKKIPITYKKDTRDSAGVKLTITPPYNIKPGTYSVEITDSSGQIIEQKFTWGVLAINTNKSVYAPQEKVVFTFAVLNETGDMVCDADLTLTVMSPQGTKTELSTANKQIVVGPDCNLKAYTPNPDFQAFYVANELGTYKLALSAITQKGSYAIYDAFEVKSYVAFDVERVAPTRIYPPSNYPVRFNVVAGQDFTGTVEEVVPINFSIEPSSSATSYDSIIDKPSTNYLPNIYSDNDLSLRLPFNGNYEQTLGFGQSLTDPFFINIYKKYNLLGHDGIDYNLPEGTPVIAADEGIAILTGEGDYGNTIVLQHPWGRSYYGHLSKIDIEKGQKVARGDSIGLSGKSGMATEAHLHFGIKLNDNNPRNGYYGKTDPTPFLTFQSAANDIAIKVISWNIAVKKGDKFTLGYQFKAPPDSPELYKLGPLIFRSNLPINTNEMVSPEPFTLGIATPSSSLNEASISAEMTLDATASGISTKPTEALSATVLTVPNPQYSSIVFQETRQWQIAADVVTTKFMDDGTDSTQGFQFWSGTATAGTSIFSDTAVKNTGPRSIQASSTGSNFAGYVYQTTVLADAGRRISVYFNFTNLPTGTTQILAVDHPSSTETISLRITSGGVLQLYKLAGQIGSNGSTLTAGIWYRITLAYTITNSTTNQFRVYVNGSSTADITASNTTLAATGLTNLFVGWITTPGASKIMNFDDIYVDDSTALTNPGDIRVTAKLANAETNTAFDFKIGNARSTTDYNNINERPLSETNGWLDKTANTPGALENYGIQDAATGDANILGTYTVVARESWVWAKMGTGTQTTKASLFNNGSEVTITLTTSSALYTNIVDSSTYPADTQAVGMRAIDGTSDTLFYEAGMRVAFLVPAPVTGPTNDQLMRHGKWLSGGVERAFTF